jgi:uncharacterized protein (UPF0548 family)
MFLLHQPSPREVEAFLGASRDLPLSYHPVGLARDGAAGFALDEHTIELGRGERVFARAKAALAAWEHYRIGWVQLSPWPAPIDPGTVVAIVVHHYGFWSMNACRVVYVIGALPNREFGFAYGTLTSHAESGEEVFKVSLDPRTEAVSYTIRAVSRHRAFLARLGHPFARALQARFRRDSAAALARALSSSAPKA